MTPEALDRWAEKPIFEVRSPDGEYAFKVWASGKIEGFPGDVVVINRVAPVVALCRALLVEAMR